MNPIIDSLRARRSVRAFEDRPIGEAERSAIIEAALQAPTAGNQVLYAILDIEDPATKAELARLCDDQPFIKEAALVLVFLADCRRWLDCYRAAGAPARNPGPGDLLLACQDAVIAAQNCVVAAESLGIGSCYIGDILERKEEVSALLGLDEYAPPITMLVFGWPTEQQKRREKPARVDSRFIVHKDRYRRLSEAELRAMFADWKGPETDFEAWMKAFCERKYLSDFAKEMSRSAGEYLKPFLPRD